MLSELSMCWSNPEKAGVFDQPRFMRIEDGIFRLLEDELEEMEGTLDDHRQQGYDDAKDDAYAEAREDVFHEIITDLTEWLEKQKSQRSFQR